MMATGASYHVEKLGFFTPNPEISEFIGPGEIGFITASIKTVADCNVGDTVKIMETRPLSKRKRWRLVEIVKRAK